MFNDTGSQSPDIGPPPVSRFDNEEPNMLLDEPAEAQDEDPVEDPEPVSSVNLETRKKRRESGPKLNIRRVSVFESPPEEAPDAATKTSRAGSKRKFSVQEDEDKAETKGDMFRFSRRNAQNSGTETPNEESRPSSPERPILGSSMLMKSEFPGVELTTIEPVNTDPMVSPKKQRSSVQDKPEKNVAPTSKPRGRPRLNISRTITPTDLPLFVPEPVPTAEIVLDALPPKTPAVADIFSPPSTEPSTSRPESKDTPPPGDLGAAGQIGAGRPGRRARPQVSYKEPSLHTKMRRPDAKLVDAVVDRRTSVDPQAPPTTSKPTVKREPSDELSWKPVSAISGRVGEEEVETGSPLRQKLDRREETKTSPASDTVEVKPSTASKAISALISETSTAKRKAAAASSTTTKTLAESSDPKLTAPKAPAGKQEDPEKDLAIFDFTDSSPAETATNPRARITDLAKAARNARRHSSVPASSLTEERKQEGALPSLHKRTVSGTVKTSTSTPSLNNTTISISRSTSTSKSGTLKDKKSTSSSTAPAELDAKPKFSNREPADEVKREKERDVSSLRAERAALRRKSMML